MSFSVTNRRSAPALKGQSVLVTLDNTDRPQLANMSIGQRCTVGTKTGYIDFIDTYGYLFRVKPDMPTHQFIEIDNLAYLMDGASITVQDN